MKEGLYPQCAKCEKRVCQTGQGKGPAFCPMETRKEVIEKALMEYDKPEVYEFARFASVQEFECYEHTLSGLRTSIPRVEEVIQFSRKMGYQRLGIATCIGLLGEARILTQILENKGFEVVSVNCKAGGIPKERIGIKEGEKIRGPGSFEAMCSPITQAEIMNSENVDLAILLGLCVGHDTLFIKYCQVPITVLVVKDRVFGHNPVAGLYLASSAYYGRLMAKEAPVGSQTEET